MTVLIRLPKPLLVAVLLFPFLVVGCKSNGGGSASPHGSCGVVGGMDLSGNPDSFCAEFEATTADDLQLARGPACPSTWSADASCPTTNRVGGCLTVFPDNDGSIGYALYWYYTSVGIQTAADVVNECTATGSTFVAPDAGFPSLT